MGGHNKEEKQKQICSERNAPVKSLWR